MIVKRPSDQTKLFLLGLLRTVSALATEPRILHNGAHYGSMVGPPGPEITLRLARRTDVPGMQRCNLASLPENYNQQFFANHMRQWPELTIVAECSDPPDDSGMSYSPFSSSQPEGNIVAYVLGKVEERSVRVDYGNGWRQDSYNPYDIHDMPPYMTERVGHVTSLAVLEPFRRQGLARELMNQLHHHLENCYEVDSVGLHVRQSNTPAEKLYKRFGYHAAERITGYYQDGEDAYLMKKRLQRSQHQQQHSRLFGSFRKAKPWESGPESLRLPRLVGNSMELGPHNSGSSPELLSGSM